MTSVRWCLVVVVATLVLGACGSGSGGSAPTPGPGSSATPRASTSPAASPFTTPAATPAPEPTGDVVGRWTSAGPDGGPVLTLAVDPRKPEVLYTGTVGGIFASVDGGESWRASSDGVRDSSGFFPRWGIIALAIDPRSNGVVYAGASDGIWKTIDAGISWVALPSDAGDAIAIDPASPQTVYAAHRAGGLRKTVDGGATWRDLDLDFPIGHVVVHPHGGGIVLAATRYGGVVVSHDGGETWQGPNANFPQDVHGFAFDHRQPDLVYAGAVTGGVFRSPDAGVTWLPWNEGLPRTGFATTSALASDRDAPGAFYAVAGLDLYVRTDGDASWTRVASSPPGGDIGSLAVVAGGTLYAATVGGITRTDAADRSWRRIDAGIRSWKVHALAIHPSEPDLVLAAIDGAGVWRSTDLGRTWAPSADGAIARARVGGIAIDSTDPSHVIASACGIIVSDDGAQSWKRTLGAEDDPCMRETYGVPLDPAGFAFDPSDPARVFAGLGDFHRSADHGQTWTRVLIPLGDGVICHGVRAVAVDPSDPSIVYAVESVGGPVRSTDGGASFPSVGCALIPFEGPAAIAIDPTSSATVYATRGRALVKSLDRGATWTELYGIDSVWSLVFDPADPTLYAGTDSGVFVSHDGAATWTPLNDGLLTAPVYAIAIDPRDGRTLLAGTEGGVQRIRLGDR